MLSAVRWTNAIPTGAWRCPVDTTETSVFTIPDDSARFLALKAGDIHATEQVSAEDLASAQSDSTQQVLFRPPLNTVYLAFNYKVMAVVIRSMGGSRPRHQQPPGRAFWASRERSPRPIPASMWGCAISFSDPESQSLAG
jgi:peptide/nickel transport system substrate-binding protein